jgi:uncharacterized protein YaaR (DUF327 family)
LTNCVLLSTRWPRNSMNLSQKKQKFKRSTVYLSSITKNKAKRMQKNFESTNRKIKNLQKQPTETNPKGNNWYSEKKINKLKSFDKLLRSFIRPSTKKIKKFPSRRSILYKQKHKLRRSNNLAQSTRRIELLNWGFRSNLCKERSTS